MRKRVAKFSKVELESICLVQGDVGAVVIFLSQSGGEITIELDRVQCPCALGEWSRDGALPRTDLNNDIVISGRDRSDNRINNARVRQEMLSESLTWSMLTHWAARVAASRTACSRLPLSAWPLPAMSSAVP